MARQRASQARDAFARVGTSPVADFPGGSDDSVNDINMASGNAVSPESQNDGMTASPDAVQMDSSPASVPESTADSGNASVSAIKPAGRKAGRSAGRSAGRKAGKARRRVGRPRGPARVPLTIRILAATDDRLTAAVEMTGQSPQYIVDAALAAYLDALGIPKSPSAAAAR